MLLVLPPRPGKRYKTKQSCRDGIRSVKRHAGFPRYYERHDNYMEYGFCLKAGNGEIVGRSAVYFAPAGRDNGIVAVKKDAVFAGFMICVRFRFVFLIWDVL